MHELSIIGEAIRLLHRLGYQVRQECLEGAGGECMVRGKRCLFLDLTASPDQQLDVLLRTLAKHVDAIGPNGISPALREHLADYQRWAGAGQGAG